MAQRSDGHCQQSIHQAIDPSIPQANAHLYLDVALTHSLTFAILDNRQHHHQHHIYLSEPFLQ
jgi:hypothetical protein